MQEINRSRKFIAFVVILLFSMTIYQNINFDKLFDYYEHNGNKEYDLENDGWIVDLESDYHRQSEFDAMFSELESRDYPATSVLLVKNGTLVYEKYYDDFSYNTVFNTYSVTKSFTSALVGIAIDKGLIDSVDDPILDYFPNETFDYNSEYKQKVTIHHILTMTSGFDYGEDPALAPTVEGSRAEFVLNSPVKHEPGSVWVYDSHAPSILIRIIELQSQMSISEFANKNLFEPLQISNVYWIKDDSNLAFGGFGLYLTPREMAKLGQLYVQGGIWNETRVVSEGWVNQSTINHLDSDIKFIYTTKPSDGYGYLWWVYDGYYIASGLHGQRVIVNPEQDYVLTFTSLDVTQIGANALHKMLITGEADPWRKPMNEYYLRALPSLGLFLFLFTAVNFSFIKYGLKSSANEKIQGKEILLTSFVSSSFMVFFNFLIILSVIFSVLDFFFGIPRGFMLFPLFQMFTLFSVFLFVISSILFERELLSQKYSISLSSTLKFFLPKNIILIISLTFILFNVYLAMITDYSA